MGRSAGVRHPRRRHKTQLNESVQQTIDRLIFLRIAEDRGIEPYGALKEALTGSGVYARLMSIFRSADVRYNSGLFHFRDEPGISGVPDVLTPGLNIDDRVLRAVVGAMYYPTSPYEFSVIPADILGQVYEQFLGKVIRLTTGHVAKVEEKPEVKKAGGVYYTPTWVVDHIVGTTLGRALEGKSPSAALKVRVLDPACGSGSFLIGAYECLLQWFTTAYARADQKTKARTMFQDRTGEWKLTLAERKRILTSCVYGVDIDRQAVEVTKLSLVLKVLEDQSIETINQQLQMFHLERVLPDLDRNIQCGNSLVGSDVSEKLELEPNDEDLLNPFDWDVAFPSIMAKGGFDVVVGNPPYDVLEKDRGAASWPHALLREYLPLQPDYQPALGGKLNLYRLFLVRAIGLTRARGHFGMIVPLSLVADISTAATRRHVLTELGAPVLDCFPQKDNPARRVFRRAKLSTVIVAGAHRKDKRPENPVTTHVYPGNDLSDIAVENVVSLADCALLDPQTLPIPLTDREEWALCRRLHLSAKVRRLAELSDSFEITRGEINQTVYRAFIRDTPIDAVPLLKGVEVGAFEQHATLSQGNREWLDEKSMLMVQPRKEKPPGPRIATQRITGVDERQRLVATIVGPEAWFADSTNSVAPVTGATLSLEFLVGLLNSDLFQWRFRLTSTNNNVGTNEMLCLPIRVPDLTDPLDVAAYAAVCSASDRLFQVKANRSADRSSAAQTQYERKLEAAFNRLNITVYELFGLDEEERRLITTRLSRPAELLPGRLVDSSSELDDD